MSFTRSLFAHINLRVSMLMLANRHTFSTTSTTTSWVFGRVSSCHVNTWLNRPILLTLARMRWSWMAMMSEPLHYILLTFSRVFSYHVLSSTLPRCLFLPLSAISIDVIFSVYGCCEAHGLRRFGDWVVRWRSGDFGTCLIHSGEKITMYCSRVHIYIKGSTTNCKSV